MIADEQRVTQNRTQYMVLVVLCFIGMFHFLVPQYAIAEHKKNFHELQLMRAILEQDEEQLDLAEIKLSIDKLIDPTLNTEAAFHTLQKMLIDIRSMLPSHATDMQKMLALRAYLYRKGPWNQYQVYQYDFDDPLGTRIANKLLPNYLTTKKGNCVSMPLLFLILGQRLGLNVTASLAPLHIFVKFTDTDGRIYNLETTSGANVTRDVWYRTQMPITDQAIRNGIYLQPLSQKETVTVMITVLAEYYFQRHEYLKSMGISDLSLQYYPNYVTAMLRMGSAFYRLIQEDFQVKYPTPQDIPPERRAVFRFLSEGNHYWFARAEALGWREPPKESDKQYLQKINKIQQQRGE